MDLVEEDQVRRDRVRGRRISVCTARFIHERQQRPVEHEFVVQEVMNRIEPGLSWVPDAVANREGFLALRREQQCPGRWC